MAVLLLFSSCNDTELICSKIFSPEIELSVAPISKADIMQAQLNSTIEFKVLLNNTISANSANDFTFQVVNTKGGELPLTFNNSGASVYYKQYIYYSATVDNDFLSFTLTPNKVDSYSYDIYISDGTTQKVVNLTFNTPETLFSLDYTSLFASSADSLEVERPKEFTLNVSSYMDIDNISSSKSSSSISKYSVSYNFTKGNGLFQTPTTTNMQDSIDADNYAQLTELASGDNYLVFTPLSLGENEVELKLTDEFGVSSTKTFTIPVKRADFAIELSQISAFPLVNNLHKIQAQIDNFDHPTNTSFDLAYEVTTISTTRSSSSAEITELGEISANSTIDQDIEIPLDYIGMQTITIYATDKFNTTKSANISITASDSEVSLVSPESVINGTKLSSIPFTVNAITQDQQISYFTLDFTMSQGGSEGTILYNGAELNPDTRYSTNRENIFTFNPTSIGNVTITATVVTYNNGSKYSTEQVDFLFAVSENEMSFTLSNYDASQTFSVEKPVIFTHLLTEDYYTDYFTVLFEQVNGAGELSTPTLSSISHQDQLLVKSGVNSNYTYTPATIGEHELRFTMTDTNGQQKIERLVFIAQDLPPSVISSTRQDPSLNETCEFTLMFSKEYYSYPTMSVSYTLPTGAGEFKMGGTTITNGSSFDVAKDVNTAFSYTPSKIGSHEIVLYITPEGRTTSSYSIKFDVSLNQFIVEQYSFDPSAEFFINSSIDVGFTAYEDYYYDDFTIMFEQINGAGNLSTPTDSSFTHKETTTMVNNVRSNFTYIPTSVGEHELHFVISDTNEQTVRKELKFDVQDTNINVVSTSRPTPVTGEPSSWHLTFSKDYYSGSNFELKWYLIYGSGSLDVAEKSLAQNTTLSIDKETPISFRYTPAKAGYHELQFNLKSDVSDLMTTYTVAFDVPVVVTESEDNLYSTLSGVGSYQQGEIVTITATPMNNYSISYIMELQSTGDYRVVAQSDQTSVPLEYSFTASEDISFKVITRANSFMINALSSEDGTTSGSGNYEYGSLTLLTATPAYGYQFSHWEYNDTSSNANPLQVTVVDSFDATAVFTPAEYFISVNSTGEGTINNITPSFMSYYKDTFTLVCDYDTSTTKFEGWYIDDYCVSTSPTATFTTTGMATYTAKVSKANIIIVINGTSYEYEYGATVQLSATKTGAYCEWVENDSTLISTDKYAIVYAVKNTSYTFNEVFVSFDVYDPTTIYDPYAYITYTITGYKPTMENLALTYNFYYLSHSYGTDSMGFPSDEYTAKNITCNRTISENGDSTSSIYIGSKGKSAAVTSYALTKE